MKLKTKIWLLPGLSAALMLVSIAVNMALGQATAQTVLHLKTVDVPQAQQADIARQRLDRIKQLLQSAVAESDADKLKQAEEAQSQVAEILTKAANTDAHAKPVLAAFNDYRSAANAAVKAVLAQADAAALVPKMQQAGQTLDAAMQQFVTTTAKDVDEGYAAVSHSVERGLWTQGIFIGVLLVLLGVAAKLIVRSVLRDDLGDEPVVLRDQMLRIAEGELQAAQAPLRADDRSLSAALQRMTQTLRETIEAIHRSSGTIAATSSQIAGGNQDLQQRTDSAASSLQHATNSMAEFSAAVQRSAEAARQAHQLASQTASAAEAGGQVVAEVVDNMSEIGKSSTRITEIIGVIDGIAFQTNILALNAAVEAARAGEQGRGFAVVAAEVRSLAQRSAQAAREIKGLIDASTARVTQGTKLVDSAGAAMREIVERVNQVSCVIAEVTDGAQSQSASIEQISHSVSELDSVTQQNAALVQHSAVSADELQQQADELATVVATFKLQPDASTAPRSAWRDQPARAAPVGLPLPRDEVPVAEAAAAE